VSGFSSIIQRSSATIVSLGKAANFSSSALFKEMRAILICRKVSSDTGEYDNASASSAGSSGFKIYRRVKSDEVAQPDRNPLKTSAK
jgi:hypothetical protein